MASGHLMHAARMAATTRSSCSGKIVRTSSLKQSFATYPMTGGVALRRREANSSGEQFPGTISMVTDGILDLGNVPPPPFATLLATATCRLQLCRESCVQIDAARARNSSAE